MTPPSCRLLLIPALLVGTVASTGTLTADTTAGCLERLGSYSGGRLGASRPLELRGREGGALYYFGAVHSSSPRHSQFDRIRRAFAEFAPTVVFHEGHESGIGAGREATIRQHGEAGLVRLLAAQAGLPDDSLEPAPQDEVALLAERFGAEKVELFFLLREAARLRLRRQLNRDELEEAVAGILSTRALPGISPTITDLDELDAAFWRYWRYPRRWWQAERAWFDPFLRSASTGGVFTNEIARASAEIRDRHMVRLLAGAVLAGERVFAVVGRDHVAVQAPALRCAVGAR